MLNIVQMRTAFCRDTAICEAAVVYCVLIERFVLQRHPLIDASEAILCDGILKNNRGTVSTILRSKDRCNKCVYFTGKFYFIK